MADNILSIVFEANLSALQSAMAEASSVVGRTVKDITAAAATMPAGVEAAAIEAGAAMSSFAPQIQVAATRVLDLKAAQTQLAQSIRETEAMVAEEGSAQEVGASIIQNYSKETLAAAINQQKLSAAVAEYKQLLNDAFEAQLRLEAAQKAGVALVPPIVAAGGVAEGKVAPAEGVTAAEAGAAGIAAGAGVAGEEVDKTAEAAVLGVESVTAAKEAETAAKERDAEASAHDAAAEVSDAEAAGVEAAAVDRLTESFLTNLVANNAELAASERGMAALKEQAAAGANLASVRSSQRGLTQLTVAQEEQLAAAEARVTQSLANLRTMQQEVSAQRQAALGIAQGQAAVETEVSAAEAKVAEAKVAHVIAQSQLSSAQEAAVATGGADARVMKELAAAQAAARTTALELAEAEKVANAEFIKGASVLDGFRMRVIAGENGMRSFITSSLTSVPVMIGMLVTGFAIHAVDAIKDTIIELDNLSKMTGITVAQLGAMGRAAEEFGAKSEDLTQMMRRLDRTIADAMSGGSQAQLTLRELGVDLTALGESSNRTSLALAQMSDYLHANAGNTEVMRAGMRALGTDSVALEAFLAKGAQGVREASEKYMEFGHELQENVKRARELEAAQRDLNMHWDEFKIAIMPAVTGLIAFGNEALRTIEVGIPLIGFLKDVANTWDLIRVATGLATAEDEKYMALQMKQTFAAPKPPEITTPKPGTAAHGGAVVSIMPELREELAQQEATFQGSRADMLRMEVMFWDQVIETGRVKGKDLIAAKRDLYKAEIDLRREVNSEIIGDDNALAALAKQGSADRVALEQKTVNDVRAIYGTESKEYERANEQLMLSKKSQVEEEVRLNLEATNRSVATYKAGSVEKVHAYDTELAALAIYLEAADEKSIGGSEAQKIIARAEADFIIEQIKRVTTERLKSVEENKAQLAATEASDAAKATKQNIDDIKMEQKIEESYYASHKTLVNEMAASDLISKTTKIQALDAIAAAEYRVEQATLGRERNELEAEAAVIRGLQGQEDKYNEILQKIREIDAQIYESTVKRNNQIQAANMQMYAQQLSLFTKTWQAMDQSLQQNISKMIAGQETFGQGMLKVWASIVIAVRQALIQMLLDYAKHEAAKLLLSQQAALQRHVIQTVETAQATIMENGLTIVHAAAEQAKVGATVAGEAAQETARTTGASEGIAQDLIQTLKIITHKAAAAAASAFQWVMTNVPFPANVVLAPAAAGAAFAGVMAFGALASAAGGAEVPHDMIMQVHKNEMVLPATIAGGMKSMIANAEGVGGNRSGAAASAQFHYSPQVSAFDAKGVKSVLDAHSEEFMKMVRTQLRRGR